MPATGRVLLERERLTELISRLRTAVPLDIQEALQLLETRENVINQALLEARRIKSNAEDEAKELVRNSEIIEEAQKRSYDLVADAQRQAQLILDEANAQSSTRREGADQYAQKSLQKLEEELVQVLDRVRRGLEMLDSEREPLT